jgi:hypothetical protein
LKWLAVGLVPMCFEVDVLHVVLTGPVPSQCPSAGAACWLNRFAADQVLMYVEVDVSDVAFAVPLLSHA